MREDQRGQRCAFCLRADLLPVQRLSDRAAATTSHICSLRKGEATAVPQLLYPDPTVIKGHRSQENATLHDAGKGM